MHSNALQFACTLRYLKLEFITSEMEFGSMAMIEGICCPLGFITLFGIFVNIQNTLVS